jgi:outer membrane receptor protein involved in Fe transport
VFGARPSVVIGAGALALCSPGKAWADTFDVPPGPLGVVAAALGSRAGITLTVADPELATHMSRGVRGHYSVRQAIARMIEGTGGEAVFLDARTVRIVRRRPISSLAPTLRPLLNVPPPEGHSTEDIVVTATKQTIPLRHYPGSATVVDLDDEWVARNGPGGTNALRKLLPILGSTDLGPARNKLFLRGIADSSFNGPTQATVGQFLGDVRLTYNAPDPNLNLYDIKRVEVLSGPQGTLHGTAALGGIIRIVPNAPDPTSAYGTATDGVTATEKGDPGVDGAIMVNLPIRRGRSAMRVVAFAERQGGYIDAPARGLSNINSTDIYGTRIAFSTETDTGWKVEVGAAIQNTRTRDGQYTLRQDPAFTRDNAIAQPFRNDYRLGYFTVRRAVGKGEMVSTTSLVRHDLSSVFDATGYDGTAAISRFEERNGILLLSHETRLSGGGRDAPWVIGGSGIYSVSGISRLLGPDAAPMRITGVVNEQTEAAVFGQISRPLSRTVTGTVGMRLTYALGIGHLVSGVGSGPDELRRHQLRRSATIAAEWHPRDNLSLYYRYQQGYRAGGLAIAPSGATATSQQFVADDLDLNEIGFRLQDDRHGISAHGALFHAGWGNIQADLVDATGLPYTANIGNGQIIGLEGEVSWRPVSGITLSAAAFSNRSKLLHPAAPFVRPEEQPLPNVAQDGARFSAKWQGQLRSSTAATAEASLRYVGESRLGVGPLLDFRQGNYLTVDLAGRLAFGAAGVSLAISNLTDVRGNSFAFGNPFGLLQGNQITPLRPRSVRLGVDFRF